MLNRRILRIKAMQCIYAFRNNRDSDFLLAVDQIRQAYEHEYMMVGIEGKPKLDFEEIKAKKLFRENYQQWLRPAPEQTGRMERIAVNAAAHYHKLIQNDFRSIKQNMVAEAEKLYSRYVNLLMLLLSGADRAAAQAGKKNMVENPLLGAIRSSPVAAVFMADSQYAEDSHRFQNSAYQSLAQPLAKLVLQDTGFGGNTPGPETDPDTEQLQETGNNLCPFRYMVMEMLFKNPLLLSEFEEEDLRWEENRPVLKSMLLKTLKNVNAGEKDQPLMQVSRSWEEDKQFFVDLFDSYFKDEDQNALLIAEKAAKWSSERIAKLDHILLGMAMAEMSNFPSIPVKVTINEYLDVSKQYSTPKSWQFINGMLETLSAALKEKGLLKKSGRGLIDNK